MHMFGDLIKMGSLCSLTMEIFSFFHFLEMFYRKQPLYLHEVSVRSAYIQPSSDPTCGITLHMLLFRAKNCFILRKEKIF